MTGKPKKILIALGIIFVSTLGLVFIKNNQESLNKQKAKETTVAVAEEEPAALTASGKIKAERLISLKFQTSGRLDWIGVAVGDRVKAGQVIARLDLRDLKKDLEKKLRDYAKERNDFEEDAATAYPASKPSDALNQTMKRILEKNQWDLEKAVLDVEIEELKLQLATLTSPINGIITNIESPVAGVNITAATAEFTLADPNSVYFSAEVDEIDISKIKIGQSVTLTLDAYENQPLKSQVALIGFQAITTSGGGTAFEIKIPLPENTSEKFKIGMNGEAEINISKE